MVVARINKRRLRKSIFGDDRTRKKRLSSQI